MVKIIYYSDPLEKPSEIVEVDSVIDFLLPRFKCRDELLDLRFFDTELLGHEIDQSKGEFLDINDGVIVVTHDSKLPRGPETWLYVLIGVVFAAVAMASLKPDTPEISGRDQKSATNRLGDTTNEPRINQRIDDVFGRVNKHMPSLLQVPYRIGVNDQEVEVLYTMVGRGKYELHEWYDGDTPVANIPNAAVNVYGPNTNPLLNSTPEWTIGDSITEKIGIYRQSNDLNPSELQPPNALENAGIKWRLSGSGGNAVMYADLIPDGFDFQSFYKVGDKIRLNQFFYLINNGTVDLYYDNGIANSNTGFFDATNPANIVASNDSQSISTVIPAGAITVTDGTNSYSNTSQIDLLTLNLITATIPSETITVEGSAGQIVSGVRFKTYTLPVDLGQSSSLEYTILSVTSNTLTLSIPVDAPAVVVNAWAAMTDYYQPAFFAELNYTGSSDVYVIDPIVTQYDWKYLSGGIYYPVTVTGYNYYPVAGVFFNNVVGPVFVPSGSTEVILNFVSPSGFYKFVENNEQSVAASILIKIYELDINGDETGNITPFTVGYGSNESSITQSVFRTVRLTLPYSRCKITAQRESNRDKRTDVSNVDVVEWRDLYSFEPVGAINFGDVTTAHVLIPSNSQSRLIKQRKQNVDLTRKITQYLGNGVFGAAETYATDQIDQIIIHSALDPRIGRLTIDEINADGFMSYRQEMINYFGSNNMSKFGYVFDTTNMTYQDMFTLMCQVVFWTPYVQAGVYDAYFERPQSLSTMQVTCRNKKLGSETRKINYDRKYDGVEVSYRDNITGTSETIYVPSDQSAVNPQRITLNGCTTALQAMRYAKRVYNRQKYETEFVKFDVDEFGRNIIPSKRIDSPDSTRFSKHSGVTDGYRVYDGEVVEVDGFNVELSEPFEFVEGEDYYITFTKKNGQNSESILCTQVDEYTVKLNSLPVEPIYDGYQRDRTKYILVSEQLKESTALLPRTIEFSINDDGEEVNTISAVNYTDKYYQNDLDTLE